MFLLALAWIFGVCSTGLLLIRIALLVMYTDHDRLMDAINGVHTTFPLLPPFVIAVICWTFIFTL